MNLLMAELRPRNVFLIGPTPASFLFIFVLFKHNIIEKNLGFSRIRTRIVGEEGELADHMTTTTAQGRVMLEGSCAPKL